MKIAFRTSGGRGEYELAGSQGSISSTEFANYEIDFQISPGVSIPGKCALRIKNGKPRIRLNEEDSDATHIQRWLSAFLLLRKPNRVRGDNIAESMGSSAKYQIASVQVDIVSYSAQTCVLRPTIVEIYKGQVSEHLSVPDRISRIRYVLENSEYFSSAVQSALLAFGEAFALPKSHKGLEHLRNAVYDNLIGYENAQTEPADALPVLENILAINNIIISEPETASTVYIHSEDDKRSEIEIRSDYLRSWRLVAERGYQGRKFSRNVIDAYDYRCFVSGVRLPKTSVNAVPGVDAAHILPWAKYDLNRVSNGLCLAKTYHWAFDSGIIRIFFDPSENSYVSVMDERTKKVMIEAKCDLSIFESSLGVIPKSRLPKHESLWPNPIFLEELNKLLTGC